MKFNKTIQKYKVQYSNKIPTHYWFDYKHIKKLIKQTNSYESVSQDECCICLESNTNLMTTFCCHQNIHHTCFVHTMAFSKAPLCPLCRADIANAIQYDKDNTKQVFDANIISIISYIHLNMMKIKDVCEKKLIQNTELMKKYKKINHTALIKICKKMNKHLHVNTVQYFLDTKAYKNII